MLARNSAIPEFCWTVNRFPRGLAQATPFGGGAGLPALVRPGGQGGELKAEKQVPFDNSTAHSRAWARERCAQDDR